MQTSWPEPALFPSSIYSTTLSWPALPSALGIEQWIWVPEGLLSRGHSSDGAASSSSGNGCSFFVITHTSFAILPQGWRDFPRASVLGAIPRKSLLVIFFYYFRREPQMLTGITCLHSDRKPHSISSINPPKNCSKLQSLSKGKAKDWTRASEEGGHFSTLALERVRTSQVAHSRGKEKV